MTRKTFLSNKVYEKYFYISLLHYEYIHARAHIHIHTYNNIHNFAEMTDEGFIDTTSEYV